MKTKRNTTHYQHRRAKTAAIMRTQRKYVKDTKRKIENKANSNTQNKTRKIKQSCGEIKDYFKAGGQGYGGADVHQCRVGPWANILID